MSQFLQHTGKFARGHLPDIDFDDAVKLPGGGSTCDVYRTRWQRREVFVKRLKEEYRSNPLYLDALDKEFDIGVKLMHPSLPEYREFHRDYIVMDYIDCQTLDEMIRNKDPWLASEKHIVTLLKQLVDVVDYLHRHNVVHCDIKSDNIMIVTNSKNLVLIDFDKCYTDALRDTSGHPGKYGLPLDEQGRLSIDFHGIAQVTERLKEKVPRFKFHKYKEFIKACYSPNANCEELSAILAGSGFSSYRLALLIGGGMLTLGITIGVIGRMSDRHEEQKSHPIVEVLTDTTGDSIMTDEAKVASAWDESGKSEADGNEAVNVSKENLKTGAVSTEKSPEKREEPGFAYRTQQEIREQAKKKAALLDKEITPNFDRLQKDLDRLQQLKDDPNYTGQQLLDSIRVYGDRADEYLANAFALLKDMFPGTSDREAMMIMSNSKAYTGYTRRYGPLGREYRQEYERRAEAEGTILK